MIDRCLLAILRRRFRDARRFERLLEAQPVPTRWATPPYVDTVAFHLDVQTALSRLSEDERQICEALSYGLSIREVAACLGCDWHTANRRIARIRARFIEMGLDGWLEAA